MDNFTPDDFINFAQFEKNEFDYLLNDTEMELKLVEFSPGNESVSNVLAYSRAVSHRKTATGKEFSVVLN